MRRLDLLQQLVDEDTVQTILDSKCQPFPTLKPMDKEAHQKQTLYGHRFEVSILLFEHCLMSNNSIDTLTCSHTRPAFDELLQLNPGDVKCQVNQ